MFYEYSLVKENDILRLDIDRAYEQNRMANPKDVVNFFNCYYKLDSLPEEYVYILALDIKLNSIGVFELSHGGFHTSVVDPKGLYARILLCGASNYILIHNHPSSDVTPSKDDLLIMERATETGKLMECPLRDFIIIGNDIFYSAQMEGEIK